MENAIVALRPHQQPELFGLSLCAGYAGLDLGITIAEPRYRTVCYVEREAHAAATLVARMEDAALDRAPVWDDLRSFDGRPWRGRVHILSAGYPCQPFTYSGRRKGTDDPRHLWPEVERIIGEIEPPIVFLENVEGHVTLGLAQVAGRLDQMGYTAKAGLFTAREVGASHTRRRLFILAYANRYRQRPCRRLDVGGGTGSAGETSLPSAQKWGADNAQHGEPSLVATVDVDEGARLAAQSGDLSIFPPGPSELSEWERLLSEHPHAQPAVLRMDDGLANQLDRTRGVGNGVCSMAAAVAYTTLQADFARDGWSSW